MRVAALLLFCLAGLAPAQDARPASFSFRSGFWVNLHHFLYVLGRAREQTPDTRREAVVHAPEEAAGIDDPAWEAAVRDYQAGLSKKDAVFDKDLIAITTSLAKAGDAASLAGTGIPEAVRQTLERAAPVYRRVFWERHAAANRARIEEQEKLLAQYGRQVGEFLAKVYRQRWPAEPQKVEVVAYANWAGAYSTDGGLIVIASRNDDTKGSRALEIVFHEAMHQWDDSFVLLNQTAERLKVRIPPSLFHSFIFYTAGYAAAQAVPGHRPYAENMWGRLPGKQALDAHWLPYLKGEGTLEQAIERVVATMSPR